MARARTRLNYAPIRTPVGEPRVHIQTLGACQIQVGNERLSPAGETLFSLVLRLVYAPDLRLTRDEILPMLWPGLPESRQRGNLRQALYKLRQLGVLMELHGDDVRLDERQVARTFAFERTDERFQRDVLDGHEPFGPFLPGFEPRSAEFKEWIDETRELVHAEVRRVLVSQLRRFREGGDWARAEQMARRLLQFDPLNEEATLTLAECTALNGGKAQAIEIIDRYLSELGADAGDIRIPATTLRRRIAEPQPRRVSFAPTERHFVGREEEIAELTLAMRRARWHDGSAYLIYGPPGMGKTRLTYEVAKVATLEGMFQLRFSCRESDGMRPLSLVLDLVTELLAAPGALGCAPDTLKHLRRLVGEEPVVLLEDGTPAPRDPLPGPSAIRRAIADILAAVSEEKPVFLVIDDVHWLDVQSWDVLVDLMERVEVTRVCMLLTSRKPHACAERPERVPMKLQVRELGRLTEEQSLRLAKLSADDWTVDLTEPVEQQVKELSDGIPLFVLSIVSHWHDVGASQEFPSTLTGVIEQKLMAVSPISRRIVQIVSLLQEHARIDRLPNVLGESFSTCLDALDELAAARIDISSSHGALSAHDVLSTVSLRSLSPSAAKLIHRQIAEVLLTQTQRSSAETLSALRHLHLSDQHERFELEGLASMDLLASRGDHPRLLQLTTAILSLRPDLWNRRDFRGRHSSALKATEHLYQLVQMYHTQSSVLAGDPDWDLEHPEEAVRLIASQAYVNREALEGLAKRATAIAVCKSIELEHRCSAATVAIKLSSDADLPDNALQAYSVVLGANLDNDSPHKHFADMYYHTVFGDLTEAARAASSLLTLNPRSLTDSKSINARINAAYALRFAGDWRIAEKILSDSFDDSMSAKMLITAYVSAYYLSIMEIDKRNNIAGARRWNREMEGIADGIPEQAVRIISDFHPIRILIAESRFDEGLAMWAKVIRCHPEGRLSERHRIYLRFMELALHLGTQSSHAEYLLSSSMQDFERVKRRPAVDFYACQIAHGLLHFGRVDEAKKIIGDFLRHRQDVNPPAVYLEEVFDKLANN